MAVKGFVALGTATIALLAGPGVALAQDEGTAGDPASVEAVPSEPVSEPATTTESDAPSEVAAPSDTDTSSDPVESTSTEAAPEPAPATSEPAEESVATAAATVDQPQAEVEASSRTVTHVGKDTKGGSCLTAASATPRKVGPPGPGCTRVDGGQISNDPANPTVLPPINGVTVGIWIVDTPGGPEVHWQIISGTFNGTDAIDLKVKGGPDPNGFTCQITAATPTGICHAPFNENSGKWYGVSHVDACPGSTTVPPSNPPGSGGPGAGGVAGQVGQGGQGQQGQKGQKGAKNGQAPGNGSSPAVSAAAVPAAPGEELPVTGLELLWLLLIGGGLVGGGAAMRTRLS
jgi:hypothetical protein